MHVCGRYSQYKKRLFKRRFEKLSVNVSFPGSLIFFCLFVCLFVCFFCLDFWFPDLNISEDIRNVKYSIREFLVVLITAVTITGGPGLYESRLNLNFIRECLLL